MRLGIVLGSAACAGEDLLAAHELVGREYEVYAVNQAAADWPGELEAFVTLHFEHLDGWLRQREAAGHPSPRHVVTHGKHPRSTDVRTYLWPGMNASGSSGLFGVKVALEYGCDRVVLCGVPMTMTPHYGAGRVWDEVESFTEAWMIALPRIKDKVRSMSGFTRGILGAPTVDWLGAA